MNTIDGLTLRWQPWTFASLLAHLWQSTLVGVAVLGVLWAARRASARTRWAIGWIGLAKFALPIAWFAPALSGLETLSTLAWRRAPAALAAAAQRMPSAGPGPAVLSAVHLRVSWAAAALGAWAVGAAVLIGLRCARGHRFRRRILAAAGPLSPSLRRRVAWAAARVGLPRPPRCVVTSAASGPGVLGFPVPVIVLPQSLEGSLSGPEIDAVLLHECTHLRRRDPIAAGVQALFVRILWFHPVAWGLDRRLRLEMEKSCDEAVLDMTSDARAYAEGILKVVRLSLGLQAPGFTGAVGVCVPERLRNILSRGASPHLRRPKALAIAAAALIAALSGFSAATHAEAGAGALPGPVLVLRNPATAGRSLDFASVLGDIGYPCATRDPADLSAADFAQYRLIVVPAKPWTTASSAEFLRTAERFDRFVSDGGILLVEITSAGDTPPPPDGPRLDPRGAHLIFLNPSLWNP